LTRIAVALKLRQRRVERLALGWRRFVAAE
jgi:hypothetical protein